MKKSLILTALFAFVTTAALAGEIKLNQLPKDTKWVVQVNLEKLLSSKIGKLVRAEADKKGLEEKLNTIQQTFGIHPLKDIEGVTLYGLNFQDGQGVVIIKGRFQRDKLLNLLKLNETYEETIYNSNVIHSWTDKNKRQHGCFYGNDLIIISASIDDLKTALDVLDGSGDDITHNSSFPVLKDLPAGTFFVAAAEGYSTKAANNPDATILKKSDKGHLFAGELDGDVFINLVFRTRTDDDAKQIEQMLQGLKAFGQLMQDKNPALADLAQAVQISLTGKTVEVNLKKQADALFELMKNMQKSRQNKPKPQADTEAAG